MKKTMWIAMLGFALACSSSTTGNDAGTGTDSGGEQPDAAVVNGCTTYTDMTTGSAVVTGPSTSSPSQYSPNCVHVKVGQSVTFNSDFSDHPLVPFGGDTPNPITATSSGTTASFTFANAGTFGFHCGIHTTLMFGAVEVTP